MEPIEGEEYCNVCIRLNWLPTNSFSPGARFNLVDWEKGDFPFLPRSVSTLPRSQEQDGVRLRFALAPRLIRENVLHSQKYDYNKRKSKRNGKKFIFFVIIISTKNGRKSCLFFFLFLLRCTETWWMKVHLSLAIWLRLWEMIIVPSQQKMYFAFQKI